MATYYSNYYTLATDNRTYVPADPTNVRAGESIWLKASATIPTTAVATELVKFGQVVAGLRPVAGILQASAVNGSLTMSLGYTGAATAIVSASTAFQAVGATALTPAQIIASTPVSPAIGNSPAGVELIGTIGGTMSNQTVVTVWLQLVNVGS